MCFNCSLKSSSTPNSTYKQSNMSSDLGKDLYSKKVLKANLNKVSGNNLNCGFNS